MIKNIVIIESGESFAANVEQPAPSDYNPAPRLLCQSVILQTNDGEINHRYRKHAVGVRSDMHGDLSGCYAAFDPAIEPAADVLRAEVRRAEKALKSAKQALLAHYAKSV